MIKKKELTKQEAKKVLKKAEKQIKVKEKEDKLDLILGKLENFENRLNTDHQRLDRIDNLLSKRDNGEQKKQLTPEEKLAQARTAREKVAGQQQPGQTQGQLTAEEQRILGATQQFQQDVAQAQAQQEGQQQPGKTLTPQSAWLLERAADAAKVIVPAILQSKNNTGTPLKAFFEQLRIYQAVENTIMSGFFNFMKMLPGNQRQAAMSGIMASPPVPTMTNLPVKSEIIQ